MCHREWHRLYRSTANFIRIGVQVVPLHTELDYSFPYYNPNPEDAIMLQDMSRMTRACSADFALGFDGDGDRFGVVDNTGAPLFTDKIGVILARDLAKKHPGSCLVIDIKSTCLFMRDPVLKKYNITIIFSQTGRNYIQRCMQKHDVLAGFERSGHFFLARPFGKGYDCAMHVAIELCKLMERNPKKTLSDLYQALPLTYALPTTYIPCSDVKKYAIVKNILEQLTNWVDHQRLLAQRNITQLITLNGVRVVLDNAAWGLVRASSNTPDLVVVCESLESLSEAKTIHDTLISLIKAAM